MDRHYENLKKFGVNVVVCLNRYNTDTDEEIFCLQDYCEKRNYSFAISTAYVNGSEGAIDLANQVLNLPKGDFHCLYDLSDSIVDKINKVCKDIYGASKVNYGKDILNKIKRLEENEKNHFPICVAKTQYSFSDDAKKVGVPKDFEVTVKDICLYNGARFVTVLLGDIMVMPGLSKKPNYELIDVINGEIVNLS